MQQKKKIRVENDAKIPDKKAARGVAEVTDFIAEVPDVKGPQVTSLSPGQIDYNPPLLICLSILMRISGHPVSTEAIKSGLPIGKEPPSVGTCIRAAERAGMSAKAVYRKGLHKISPLTLPCILLLENSNACVLTRVTRREAEVIFPENENTRSRVAVADLEKEYTNNAVFARLRGRLDKRASELKLLNAKRWFWGNILRFFPIYTHVILASVVVNMLAIASPLFVMNVYDRVVPNNALDTLWILAVGVMIAYGFDFLLKNLRGYFVDVAGKNADVLIASKLMQQVMGMQTEHKPESTGSLANNLREFESLRDFFSSSTLLSIVDMPFLFIFILIIYFIGGPLCIIPIIAVPLVILVGLVMQYPFQRFIEDGFKESTQKNALLVEIINGLETIKSSLAEGPMQRRWEKIIGMSAVSSSRAKALANFSITFTQFVTQLVSVGIIIFGVYRISLGELTMGGLIACNILLGRAMAPLGAVAAVLTRFQQSRMALKSLDLLMQIPNERPDGKEFIRHENLESTITFSQVTFQYPNAETLALNNITSHIGQGEKVGIIGRVGSGKSTIGRLCQGLYHPQQGAAKVGGVDIRQLDIADLRRKIGYVAQDNYLFYGSIKDNITLGLPYADDRSILDAAVTAGVMDFLRLNPAGFGLQVGERGMNLSGGQRQAITIARALLQDPDILILDEPTSSMDNSTENLFRQRLQEKIKDKTLVLITHRFSMLSLVDRLIVMDGGRILVDGPKGKVLVELKNEKLRGVDVNR
ncbi:MAG: type I secretion system permease/ATPase [Desulfobacteraceae bacterium]|nr:type I secretion system permease/ATPase [Desulfobacteraceae bacterium]